MFITAETEITIQAPAEEIWNFAGTPANWTESDAATLERRTRSNAQAISATQWQYVKRQRRSTMKVANTVVRKTLLATVASLGLAAAVPQSFADTAPNNPPTTGGYGPGYGMGSGMMGGYGPGYGMGPGMMGGYGGYGMMGGYGMGPGMMGGYGMGPGMMGGCGGYGYGRGYGWAGVNLTDAQRSKIAKIQEDAARERWELMGKMHEQGFKMRELYATGKLDDAALKQAYDTMAAMRKAMFVNMLETRKKIEAVLTKEQREKLRGG